MKTTCAYCAMSFDAQDAFCPYCGAPNENASRALREKGQMIPRTVEELKRFCESHRMPLEKMRFFIGEDYRGPRAFGVYRDQRGDFIVYKNKSDGTRAVRYKGPDEAHAVNELYQKLREEVARRKAGDRNASPTRSYSEPQSNSYQAPQKKKTLGCAAIALIILAVMIAIGAIASLFDKSPTQGYYRYNDSYYYYQRGSWYVFDQALSAWQHASVDDAFLSDYDDYYASTYLRDEYAIDDFRDSVFYESSGSSGGSYDYDDDWDSDWDDDDWDYDYDSWDSGDTDWDSDW